MTINVHLSDDDDDDDLIITRLVSIFNDISNYDDFMNYIDAL